MIRLIDAEALKKKFAYITYTRFTADMGQGGFETFSEKEIEQIIDNAPTVEVRDNFDIGYVQGLKDGCKKPQGKWIYQPNHTHLDNVKKYYCPFCRVQVNYPSDICNNCGSDMRGANNG